MSGRCLLTLLLSLPIVANPMVSAQQPVPPRNDPDRKHVPISIEDILRQQKLAEGGGQRGSGNDINERLRSLSAMSRYSQDYSLGPADIIEVTVFGIEELKKKELTLDSQGNISLPFINEVQLLGLTARQSEIKIATLFEASVMKNPQVSVGVKEYRSQFISVLGAVFKPGTYQLVRRSFLVDALAMAGGLLAEKAESRAVVHRLGEHRETIEVDLMQLLEKGDTSLNVPIFAGDVVSVPERVERFYYVLGDVHRGGAFEIKKGERITLSKALASAGGLLITAKSNKTTIMRQAADSVSTKPIPVDVKKILRGQAADVVLTQNDVVFVPGSTTKTVGHGILNGISGVLSSLIYVGMR